MLQEIGKHYRYSCLMLLFLLQVMAGCKPDFTGVSEEKADYLADYESPANRWGFIDTTGQIVIDPIFDEVGQFSENYAAVNQKGLWGYIDHAGKMVIACQYRSAFNFHENRARVKPFDLQEYYITPSATIISSVAWNAVGDFSNGRAVVKAGSLYGYIDSLGKQIIHPMYSRAWNFNHARAVVEIKDKQGIINVHGNFILQPQYDHLTLFGTFNLIAGVKENDTFIFDIDGNQRDHVSGAMANETDGVLLSLRKNGLMFLYKIDDKKYLPGDGYRQLLYLNDHRWSARRDSTFHLLDDDGKELNSTGYDQLNKYVDGIAVNHRNGYWGYLDASGKELTKPIFGLAWDYSDGFARASFKDGLGFVNIKQEMTFLLPDGTLDVHDFHDGLAPVQIKKR